MQDKLLIKYIKKKNPKGMDMLVDNYGGIITSVVRKHLGILINYEEECVNDVLLSVDNWTKPTCTAYHCLKRKKVVIDYSSDVE